MDIKIKGGFTSKRGITYYFYEDICDSYNDFLKEDGYYHIPYWHITLCYKKVDICSNSYQMRCYGYVEKYASLTREGARYIEAKYPNIKIDF